MCYLILVSLSTVPAGIIVALFDALLLFFLAFTCLLLCFLYHSVLDVVDGVPRYRAFRALVERVDALHVLVVEDKVVDLGVGLDACGGDALREGDEPVLSAEIHHNDRTAAATYPFCRLQRISTCVTSLPCLCAISASTGLLILSACARTMGQYACTTMPFLRQ